MEQFLLSHQWIIWLALAWTLPWKAVALWKSARANQVEWFVALLVINTLGLLEILYIFFFSPKSKR
jgi:methionyl-tRNA synthetase